jgi:hypothetical protein
LDQKLIYFIGSLYNSTQFHKKLLIKRWKNISLYFIVYFIENPPQSFSDKNSAGKVYTFIPDDAK